MSEAQFVCALSGVHPQRWTENGAACSVGFEVVVVGASPVELGLLLLPVVTEVNPVAPVGLVERLDGVVLL